MQLASAMLPMTVSCSRLRLRHGEQQAMLGQQL